MGRRASDKRERLVKAAADRFHHHGLHASSIADVARDAEIPVGNVYYYFRTKDDLARAVVDYWNERVAGALGGLEPDAAPLDRLGAFIDASAGRSKFYAAFGCPLVALARDLRQSGDSLAPLARTIHIRQIEWISRLLQASGLDIESARARSHSLLASLHGSFHLAHAMGDPRVVEASAADLKRRLRPDT